MNLCLEPLGYCGGAVNLQPPVVLLYGGPVSSVGIIDSRYSRYEPNAVCWPISPPKRAQFMY